MVQQPISIVGAGIAGLTLGRCLLKRGIQTIIYDKAPSPDRHGYGVTLHPQSYSHLLKVLGLDEHDFRKRVAVDAGSGGTGQLDKSSLIHGADITPSSFRAHRGRLEQLLAEDLNVQWDCELAMIDEDEDGLALCFKDGWRVPTKLIVGADGSHSNVRQSLLPNEVLEVLPYVVFNGKRSVGDDLFREVYAPALGTSNVIEHRMKDVVLQVSVNDKSDKYEEQSISWIYFRPARGVSDVLYKPTRSNRAAQDIPEELFQELSSLENLTPIFAEVFCKKNMQEDRILHWLMRTGLANPKDLQNMAQKAVFFIGDSVHAEPIIGGYGANSAIEDGLKLAEQIAHGLDGIEAWYGTRHPVWQQEVEKSWKVIAETHGGQKALL
ncbi:FAD/NAD(P)-binding domain-containing protein [Aulographum hederae CBS 113979]|uniref:FAD/NAD(P)-binding domain-containing protein n=1 Tax=Aulographum hederae CBS 113979 TaxID=1176131 RepID=A0A6G1H2W5_9PEZI|nr:FAD/NAD(P)-binding domain-containing protein [Aulographum hederae CBS 113979]